MKARTVSLTGLFFVCVAQCVIAAAMYLTGQVRIETVTPAIYFAWPIFIGAAFMSKST